MLGRVRAEHLRELLNAQVAAAAVMADGGKAAGKIDAALKAASGKQRVVFTPSGDEPDDRTLEERVAAKAEAAIAMEPPMRPRRRT